MKKRGRKLPSIYDESHVKKGLGIRKYPFLLTALILLLLLLTRLGNLSLWWYLNKAELKSSTTWKITEVSYIYAGLTTLKKAKNKLLQTANKEAGNLYIASFYNFLQPAIFLIYNKGRRTFIDLGRVITQVDQGLTEVSFYQSDIIKSEWQKTVTTTYFGNALLTPLFKQIARQLGNHKKNSKKGGPAHSFIFKSLQKSTYLKIPYLLYFYLPLLIILMLASAHKRILFVGFFYYLEMFFLFDLKNFFVTGGFFWLIGLLKIEVSTTLTWVISGLLVLLSVIVGAYGLLFWQKPEGDSWEKPFILYLLLLPVFLRF